jgi:LPXTG-motif cell wall-anchored protein
VAGSSRGSYQYSDSSGSIHESFSQDYSLKDSNVWSQTTGGSTATTAIASVTMDAQKTVTAERSAENTMPFIVIGAIGALLVAIVALLYFVKRKKAVTSPDAGTMPGKERTLVCVPCVEHTFPKSAQFN